MLYCVHKDVVIKLYYQVDIMIEWGDINTVLYVTVMLCYVCSVDRRVSRIFFLEGGGGGGGSAVGRNMS